MVDVRIEPWAGGDLWLLRRTNAPEMTGHLGGPETEERLLARHERYVSGSDMYRIVLEPGGEVVGSIGFWVRTWRDEQVYETGWGVLPEYQGRGIAVAAAARIVAAARRDGRCRQLHAYPSVDNAPSNAICRKAGFTLLGEVDFEYPKGHPIRCHDWCLDLRRDVPV